MIRQFDALPFGCWEVCLSRAGHSLTHPVLPKNLLGEAVPTVEYKGVRGKAVKFCLPTNPVFTLGRVCQRATISQF